MTLAPIKIPPKIVPTTRFQHKILISPYKKPQNKNNIVRIDSSKAERAAQIPARPIVKVYEILRTRYLALRLYSQSCISVAGSNARQQYATFSVIGRDQGCSMQSCRDVLRPHYLLTGRGVDSAATNQIIASFETRPLKCSTINNYKCNFTGVKWYILVVLFPQYSMILEIQICYSYCSRFMSYIFNQLS